MVKTATCLNGDKRHGHNGDKVKCRNPKRRQEISARLSRIRRHKIGLRTLPQFFLNVAFVPFFSLTRSIWKMLGPFATASRLTFIHQMSLVVLSRAACASMSTTSTTTATTTTTTTTRDRGDRYGPMEWAQLTSQFAMYSLGYVLFI